MQKYIKRLLIGFTALLVAGGSLSLGIFTDEAQAATYKVSNGPLFNDPYGSKSKRMAILNQINGAVDKAPKGAVIRIATFSIKDKSSADKLIAAHKRGVKVQIITSDHMFDQEDEKKEAQDTEQLQRLMKALGTTVTADNSRSFVKICRRGCSSEHEYSTVHSKLYMFSTTGASKRVVMVGSANLSLGHAYAWNNLYRTVGNEAYYNLLVDHFYKMAKEPKNADLYQNVAVSSTMRLYTFPRNAKDIDEDVNYTMLEKVRCTGAASGYGVSGKTALDFAMFKWTDTRSQVAEKLRALADSGCRVRVITDKANMSKGILKILTEAKKGKASPIIVKDANTVKKGQERYLHHKFITINGYYVDPAYKDSDNRRSKIVFTGSPNLTSTGLRHNNEILLRLRSTTDHTAYTKNFTTIWDKYSTAFRYVDPN